MDSLKEKYKSNYCKEEFSTEWERDWHDISHYYSFLFSRKLECENK